MIDDVSDIVESYASNLNLAAGNQWLLLLATFRTL
jgi:hypothetical protein